MRPLVSLPVLVLLSLTAGTVHAALAPSKGSQLVTLAAAGPCPLNASPSALALSIVVKSDGSAPSFAIPPKQILVLTDTVVSVVNEPAGDVLASQLLIGAAGTNGSAVEFRFEPATTSGTMSVVFAPPSGIAIKSGNAVCVDVTNFTHGGLTGFVAFAHGFLAPDK